MKRIHGIVKSNDGTPIFYEAIGEGLPLIFCYGIVCHSELWKYQTRYFKDHYQIIHFDYRGHNRSGTPEKKENLTINGAVRDLHAVMNELKIKKAVLLGHSMGTNVVLQFAARYPKKVAALISVCGTTENPFKTMFNTDLSLVAFELLKLVYLKFPSHFPKMWKKTIPNRLTRIMTSFLGFNIQLTKKHEVKNYLNGVANQNPETFFYFLQDMSKFKGDKILKKVKAPTLVIAGDRDLIAPIQNQYAIQKKLNKHAKFFKVRQGSHMAHMDFHELVNLRIEKFLKKQKYINEN